MAYFLVLVLAVLAPFHHMAAMLGDSPVPKVVWSINMALIVSVLAYWIATKLKPAKAEQERLPNPEGEEVKP